MSHAMREKAVIVESAGTHAISGNSADPVMNELLTNSGYPDVDLHRSRILMPSHLGQYQLILCMERRHIEYVSRISVLAVGKTMLFGHWNDETEIDDPYGKSELDYARALDKLNQCSKQWVDKLSDMGMFA